MHFEILVTINVFSNDTPPCITLIDFHCLCIADIHSILLFYFLVLWLTHLLFIALRDLKERAPSEVPKDEFSRMICEKKSSMGIRTKVPSMPLAATCGCEARRQNVWWPVHISLIHAAQPHSSLHKGAVQNSTWYSRVVTRSGAAPRSLRAAAEGTEGTLVLTPWNLFLQIIRLNSQASLGTPEGNLSLEVRNARESRSPQKKKSGWVSNFGSKSQSFQVAAPTVAWVSLSLTSWAADIHRDYWSWNFNPYVSVGCSPGKSV